MATGTFGMTGIPGANFGGGQMAVPTPASTSTPAIGGSQNTFLPTPPTGQQTPGPSSSFNSSAASGLDNVAGLLGFGTGTNNPLHDLTKAFQKAGFSSGIGGELAAFLQSGAGFNPEVAKALIAAMQPGIQRGQADILEQFSGMGARDSSSAQVAMGDYMGQVQLNEGQIFAQLYEQSVQNYMNVLLAGKGAPHKNLFESILGGLTSLSTIGKNVASMSTGGDASTGDPGGNIAM